MRRGGVFAAATVSLDGIYNILLRRFCLEGVEEIEFGVRPCVRLYYLYGLPITIILIHVI